MTDLSRRTFLGTAGAAAAFGSVAEARETAVQRKKKGGAMSMRQDIAALVEKTPLVDTHEHVWEEAHRLKTKDGANPFPAPDFGILLTHYTDSDLQVSGMPADDCAKLRSYHVAPRDKWKLVAPYYARCRHTGYQQCVRESVRALFDEDDLREDNCEAISRKLFDGMKPGYYRHVLRDVANIEYAQVNNLETAVFMETAQPDLLAQDISTVALGSGLSVEPVLEFAKRDASDLKQWHEVIDWCFATYGPRAIATKNQSAYGRRLDYALVSEADATPLFARFRQNDDSLSPAELKALQDHLFHYCVDKAIEYNLPVKLHTGYYAGHGGMPLERLRQNASDLCPILQAHPKAKFILMHIDYPYQDEVIALAKHYPNAYVDLCWAWIINPTASVRFVKEFLMAAPACKLFTFGGDYCAVELVPGHARVARKGLAQAIGELAESGWLEENDIPGVVDRIMRGNAHETYDYERALRNWGR
ncbi:MAG: amidohydrolase family protein [Candidatus Hydrogenedentes bacterium]|nr:amidohydrolase family protein [Candidatus Hydrogenedentota bacterium]